MRSVDVPARPEAAAGGAPEFATHGVQKIATDPRLRGVPYLAVAVAAAAAMVAVNTVVLVQGELGLGDGATTVALAAFGLGSVGGGALVPRLLALRPDRTLVLAGTALSMLALVLAAFVTTYPNLLVTWVAIGVGASVAQLPATFAVRRHARREEYHVMFGGLMSITYAATSSPTRSPDGSARRRGWTRRSSCSAGSPSPSPRWPRGAGPRKRPGPRRWDDELC